MQARRRARASLRQRVIRGRERGRGARAEATETIDPRAADVRELASDEQTAVRIDPGQGKQPLYPPQLPRPVLAYIDRARIAAPKRRPDAPPGDAGRVRQRACERPHLWHVR